MHRYGFLLVVLGALAYLWLQQAGEPALTAMTDPIGLSAAEPEGSTPEVGAGETNSPGNIELISSPAVIEQQLKSDTDSRDAPLPSLRPDPSLFERSDYAGYTTEILNELADMGDVTAMQVLAMRLYTIERSTESVQEADQWMELAAVYGADHYPFSARVEQLLFPVALAAQGEIAMPQDEQRELLLEAFAAGELAKKRGNTRVMQELEDALFSYGIDAQALDVLNDENQLLIERLAGKRFEELLQQRLALGLGGFDQQ